MAGYIGSTPVPQGIKETQSFTATAGQTTFNTLGYSNGNNISVFLNGVRLINGTDYTATNGSDIVLTSAASASDVLDFETFNEFNLVNQNLTTPTFKNSMTMKNDTEEDTDGGRESTVIFQGEQSGGEISTLAEIEASHDGTSDDEKGDLIFRTNDGSDGTSPTEAARIDSSRNVLIGKTAVGSTAGIEFRGSIGYSSFTRDGNFPVTARRLTDDGDIIQFEKDTTLVGSIATEGGYTKIIGGNGTVGSGLGFFNLAINARTAAGAVADNTVSLGEASNRFKDIYLGGGAYIGGTTSANYLDDFEEGTYSFTLTGQTSGSESIRSGYGTFAYTKIGRMVKVMGRYEMQSSSGAVGYLKFSLPFTQTNALTDQADTGVGTISIFRSGTQFETVLRAVAYPGNDFFYAIRQTGSGSEAIVDASETDANYEGFVEITIFTD